MPLSHVSRRVRTATLASLAAPVAGCAGPARSADSATSADIHVVTGAFLDDGSCRVLVDGVPLFAPADSPRTSHVPAAVVNLAPPGYELDEIACAPSAELAALPPDGAGERALIVTLYAPQDGAVHAGRYVIRGALASDVDTTGIATRAAAAVFGARLPSPRSPAGGVRYLESRDGTMTLARVEGGRVAGTFTVRAVPAWTP